MSDTVTEPFRDLWWVCGECRASYPKDYAPDYCRKGCGPRLRRNDDVRLALLLERERDAA